MSDETDVERLQRARHGDEESFRQIYESHRDPVFRFAYRLLGSEAQAEDVTHDCFIGLLRRSDAFDPTRASLRTYLCGAARHLAFQQLRRRGVQVDLEEAEASALSDTEERPLKRLLDEEVSSRVAASLARLPPLQREAVILCEYEDMTLAEAAAVAGVNAATVSGRLQRARARLREWLSDLIEPATAGEALGRRR